MKFNVVEVHTKFNSFGDINCGQLFIDADGEFLMKTESVFDEYGENYNAVNIKDGVMYPISEDYQVTLINNYNLTLEI